MCTYIYIYIKYTQKAFGHRKHRGQQHAAATAWAHHLWCIQSSVGKRYAYSCKAVCCNVVQCCKIAVCCIVLRCVAVYQLPAYNYTFDAHRAVWAAGYHTEQCVCSVFAVCCRVSCVAVCCNVSNCIAVHELSTYSITSDVCRVVWVESIQVYRAVCCSVVQCGAVFCSVFAVCCNMSQHVAVCCSGHVLASDMQDSCHICCRILQGVAVCCSVLQHVLYI